MNKLEKIDYTLLALYHQTRNGGMQNVIEAFKANGQDLTIEELQIISEIIKGRDFAVFQIAPKGLDMRGQITDKGIEFVESDSFSTAGKSIISLDNEK